jgi:hypothetical protein
MAFPLLCQGDARTARAHLDRATVLLEQAGSREMLPVLHYNYAEVDLVERRLAVAEAQARISDGTPLLIH